jgi:hypothetical protein
MSHRTDAEFEQIIHSKDTHIEQKESDESKQLRSGLEPTQPIDIEELPA